MTGRPPEIVAEHGPLISRIAMSYEADPSLREDLTQQIFLAVWQAGAAYVGLDPADSDDHLRFVLEDAEVEVVIADKGYEQ